MTRHTVTSALALNPYGWQPTVDEPFRFVEQQLDYLNIRDLLRSVVNGDVYYLDDPNGYMVGFVLAGCYEPLLANLNIGLDLDSSDPGPWDVHTNLDWIEGRNVTDPPRGNLMTLLAAIVDENLDGLVDEGAGGIIGYIFPDRVTEVKRVANHTGDPNGVFGRISQTGAIHPTADWEGDGPKPKATHWYWSMGGQWVAVVDAWETAWWDGADPVDLAARPDPWQYPIWHLPPSGVLVFCDADDREHTLAIPPPPAPARKVTVVLELVDTPDMLDVIIHDALADRGYPPRAIATYPGNLVQDGSE